MVNYSDIDYNLAPTEFGDIPLVIDNESIKQSLLNVVLTQIGTRTRFQNPTFGTNINELLFEKANYITASLIRKEIEMALDNVEPRVNLIDVESTVENTNTYSITITYKIIALQIDDSVTFDIEVLR